ncbi:MAG: histidine kinase dimerization/phospho-acceptor domain-containing protein, partial [bacterium]
MKPSSIRLRLTASYLLLVLGCLVLVATYMAWRLQAEYMDTYRSVVATQSRLIARMLEEYAGEDDTAPARLERLTQEFRWRQDVIRVLEPSGIWALGEAAPPELHQAIVEGAPGESVRMDSTTGQVRIFAAAPVLVRGNPVAAVHMSIPAGWVWIQFQRMIPQLGIALAIGLLAAWIVGARLARGLVEPIDELTEVASQMSAGDLSRAVHPRGGDEIGRLGVMFNLMAERLAGTIATLSGERTKLEAVVSGMVDGVIATDRAGDVILINRAATELLGQPNPTSKPAPDGRLRILLAEAAASGRVSAEEMPPAEVGDRIVEVHCAPIAGDGSGPIGAVAVLRDVTEFRHMERLRRELTANVSHELRTPLTSIKGFAETLLGGAIADEATSRHFLGIIDKETDRLVKLVDDLLDLSRLEDKRVSLDLGQVDVGDLIVETVARMRPLAGSRDLQVTQGPSEAIAIADRDRLAQVLTNLMDNAIKFT